MICCRARMDGRRELEENKEKEVDIEYKEPAERGRERRSHPVGKEGS